MPEASQRLDKPVVERSDTTGFHASGMAEGCRSGSALKRPLYGAVRRVHVHCIQGRRIETANERRRPTNRWVGVDSLGAEQCQEFAGKPLAPTKSSEEPD